MDKQILRIAGIMEDSVCDGPGVRLVVFTQGCFHHCKGCHNPQTHDPSGGYDISVDELLERIGKNSLLDGVTFSGGEPFLQAGVLAEFAEKCHQRDLSVMVYTGYLYEEIVAHEENADWQKLLRMVDILVDGPFIQEKVTLEIPFVGSSNQRILELSPFTV